MNLGPSIVPLDVLLAAGLSETFEALPLAFQVDLLDKRALAEALKIAMLTAEVAAARKRLEAIRVLDDYVDPPVVLEPLYPSLKAVPSV
jgi:hypothetical protein